MQLSIIIITKVLEKYTLVNELIKKTSLKVNNIIHVNEVEELVMAFKKQKPDIVFFDSKIDKQGFDNFENTIILNSSIPFVVLTSEHETNNAFTYIEKGASDYLIHQKFDALLLEKCIRLSIKDKATQESLKFSNRRYELVSKATSDMVWDWDLLNNKVFRNKDGWEKILGKNSNVEIDTSDPDGWRDRIHIDDKENCDNAIGNILVDKSIQFFQLEYRIKRENNSYAYIFDKGYAVRNSSGVVTRIIGAANDITEKKALEKKLAKERLDKQNDITNAVITAQEQEREEIGRELHDNINQILTASKLYIEYSFTNEAMRDELLHSAKGFVETAVSEIRSLTKKLMPPSIGEAGLSIALKELFEKLNLVNSFTIHNELEITSEALIADDLKLTIFRIVQEQLNNTIKHAKAENVWVTITQKVNEIIVKVTDDGVGFDTAKKRDGVGLKNIYSRAQLHSGQVNIEAKIGQGCTLNILFNL